MEFKKSIEKFKLAINNIIKHNIDLNKKIGLTKSIYDFKAKKQLSYINSYKSAYNDLKINSSELLRLLTFDKTNEKNISKISGLLKKLDVNYKNNNLDEISNNLNEISNLLPLVNYPKEKPLVNFDIKNIPREIYSGIKADVGELEKCFNSGCYRSSVILCGRLLETALHRKYFEVTGRDILEKNPGIGLGNLIAKLSEKKVQFDPGITQQIHLVNQVRIFSVHKKQQAFYPTKAQTQATILYTLDILEKLFR